MMAQTTTNQTQPTGVGQVLEHSSESESTLDIWAALSAIDNKSAL